MIAFKIAGLLLIYGKFHMVLNVMKIYWNIIIFLTSFSSFYFVFFVFACFLFK